MNKNEHLLIALILLVVTYFIFNYFNLLNYLGYAVTLFIGSVIPDWTEPAKDYQHRSYFHSKKFLKILYYSAIPLLLIGLFSNWFLYLFFLVIGYISHLWLDSTTKMGLPLI